MDVLLNILTFVGVMLFLVTAHELGHFVTAKMAGVRVHEFGIGFPPRIFGIRRGETEYTLNALPIGGFVRMEGEEDPSAPRSLASASIPWRLVILAAGVTVNAVLAFALFAIAAMLPHTERVETVVINSVRANSPAAAAGIRENDSIVSVNGKPIESRSDLSYQITLNLGSPVTVVLNRDGRPVEVTLVPRVAPPPGEGATGIEIGADNPVLRYRVQRGLSIDQLAEQAGVSPDVARIWNNLGPEAIGRTEPERATAGNLTPEALRAQQLEKVAGILGITTAQLSESYGRTVQVSTPIQEAIPAGVRESWEMLVITKNDLVSTVAKRTAPQVAGPVGIFQISSAVTTQAVADGPSVILRFAALLSINLAVLNALPIPMLDGGRILFVLIEAVRGGRRISPDKEKFAHLIGAAFLFTLIIAVTFNDIVRIATGDGLFR